MNKGHAGAIEQQRRRDAAQWYVEHAAAERGEPHEVNFSEWDLWWSNHLNRIAYVDLIQLGEEMRALPAPPEPTDDEVLRDAFEIPAPSAPATRFGSWVRETWFWLRATRFMLVATGTAFLACAAGSVSFFKLYPHG